MTTSQLRTLSLALKQLSDKVTKLKRELSEYRNYADKNFANEDTAGQQAISDLGNAVADLAKCNVKIHQLRTQIAIKQ